MYLPVVSLEVANVLKGVRREELDEVGVGSSKHMAAIAEGTLCGEKGGEPRFCQIRVSPSSKN